MSKFNLAKEYFIKGRDLLKKSNYEQAESYFLKSLELLPERVSTLTNLSVTQFKLKKYILAKLNAEKAISIEPTNGEALFNLGLLEKELNNLNSAIKFFEKAIECNPNSIECWIFKSDALISLLKADEALHSIDHAIELSPDLALLHNIRAKILIDLKRFDESLASSKRAIELKPTFAEAFSNRGVALNELRLFNASLNSYNQAIALNPDLAEFYFNKSNVLTELLRIDEALQSCDRAIELKSDLECAHNKSLFLINYIYSFDPSKYLLRAINFGNLTSDKSQPKFTAWHIRSKYAKLNIGFVSGDLKNHPVGFFIEGLVKCLNKNKFNLFAFSTSQISDDLTGRIRSQFSNLIPICGLTDKDAAIKIHDQNIDVLFDLSGHTDHNRLGVFSYKPAPVQVTWLGYFASTGLPEIDYFLGDPVMSPKEEGANFSEKIWNLEETWLCFTPPSQPIHIACLPALKNEYITFGCFGNLSKINDQVIKLWATILASVPNSKLLLKSKQLGDLDVVSQIQSKFLFHKISTERLILEGSESRNRYFESYNRIDIVLDTFPYPGGTTSFEALWMGVPVVTLKGDRFLSRLGASIVTNAGLADWVATSNDDYVKRAISFSKDIPRLSRLRSNLRDQVLKTPLFNSVSFAKHFENAVFGMRDSYLQNSC